MAVVPLLRFRVLSTNKWVKNPPNAHQRCCCIFQLLSLNALLSTQTNPFFFCCNFCLFFALFCFCCLFFKPGGALPFCFCFFCFCSPDRRSECCRLKFYTEIEQGYGIRGDHPSRGEHVLPARLMQGRGGCTFTRNCVHTIHPPFSEYVLLHHAKRLGKWSSRVQCVF